MRESGLWSQSSPSAVALSSQQPFSVDTLTPEEWLQWIFIPRMLDLMSREQPVPSGFAISPYFEEVWKLDAGKQALLTLIEDIDKACQ
jgi:uncharacterized protein YqcC (DUF446 family)